MTANRAHARDDDLTDQDERKAEEPPRGRLTFPGVVAPDPAACVVLDSATRSSGENPAPATMQGASALPRPIDGRDVCLVVTRWRSEEDFRSGSPATTLPPGTLSTTRLGQSARLAAGAGCHDVSASRSWVNRRASRRPSDPGLECTWRMSRSIWCSQPDALTPTPTSEPVCNAARSPSRERILRDK